MSFKRAFRSLRQRGIAWSLDRALSVVQERFFDMRYGTDTVSFVELDGLSIKGESVSEGMPYQPTRLRLVRRILSALKPPPDTAFVDFGCGKGRVLLLAAEYGFKRVTGVEFAAELCAIARANIANYQKKARLHSDIRLVEGDAADYAIQDDERYFFMFNPFSAVLMEKIVDNIAHSLAARHQTGYIIYNNPLCGDVIERHGFSPTLNFGAGECIVYQNSLDSGKPPR